MVVVSRPGEQMIFRHRLQSLGDLLDLDVTSLLEGRGPRASSAAGPLVLVCTHGRRDRCCARLGPPIVKAVMETNAIELWQTTHLGGHRFAPTLVFLPQGLAFGRLQTHELPSLVSSCMQGRLEHLHRFRGRTFDAPAAQAADYFVRRHTGVGDIEGLCVRAIREHGDRVAVDIEVAGRGGHTVELVRQTLRSRIATSCGGVAEPVHYYALESVKIA
jgi:hypothetical protein